MIFDRISGLGVLVGIQRAGGV